MHFVIFVLTYRNCNDTEKQKIQKRDRLLNRS